MIYAHHSSEEDLLKMELGGGEASNSSNSFVCSQLVVCSSLSIQNSIWRVSGSQCFKMGVHGEVAILLVFHLEFCLKRYDFTLNC